MAWLLARGLIRESIEDFLFLEMSGVVETEYDTAKRKSLEPVSNGGGHETEDDAPEAKRRNVVRSCIHEVALPPG